MKIKKFRYFAGDFETTVYKGQKETQVWASASVEFNTEDVHIFHSIEEQWEYFKSLNENIVVYYHNLKFDGSFWLDFFLRECKYEQAYTMLDDNFCGVEWLNDKDMKNNTFKYSISKMGQWYNMVIKVNNHFIEFRDSLKLLPFSLDRIGKSFKTKHQKLDMEYDGFRYAGCEITEKEKQYIANDVLVLKEALEFMFSQGHNKLTIGSCCLEEFKNTLTFDRYDEKYPDMYKIEIDETLYGSPNAGEYIRKSYKGGWCYLVPEKAEQVKTNGCTFDVNSLYPSMMHSESGNRYPIYTPKFWKGNYIPDEAKGDNKYFFIRVKTRFYIKENKLPFIQIKNSFLYRATEHLKTSDYYDRETGLYWSWLRKEDGSRHEMIVELTLTMTDYYLFLEHYNVVDFEILDGCWFWAEVGMFDNYIEKYKQIKINSKGAMRELAKLFLNNLYGKMASNKDSSFKVAHLVDGEIKFYIVTEQNKKAGYIPIGSAITSYARNFTIRAAQKNYYGADKRGFIYADTDSIHLDLSPEEVKGIEEHDTDFCKWKKECEWDEAIFTRQKTYIEHTENGYDVKCAGMPDRCKKLFTKSLDDFSMCELDSMSQEDIEFVMQERALNDFKLGLKIHGKLLPKRIKGGVLLTETTYEMR